MSDKRIAALAQELTREQPGLVMIGSEAPAELTRLSHDFFSYSPVLVPLLEGCRAQLAIRARCLAEVVAVAGACARHGVPLTLRGAGTGNYGQCVPLSGGVVLDLSGLNRLRSLDPASGIFEAEAGCLLADLDRHLGEQGRALRLVPSTYRSATLGGFVAGGSGGIGSLRWGFLRDPGHLLGLEVVTLEPEPRVLRLDVEASAALNHAYGTNGILTALRMASTEAVDWQQMVVGFASWRQALAATRDLPATALNLHALCLQEAPIAARLPWPHDCPPAVAGEHRMLLLAAPDALEVLPGLLARRGGAVRWQARQGKSRGVPLRELTWNHTTLHWRAQEPGWTYLQMLLPEPEHDFIEALRTRWDHDLLWHLEAVRQSGAGRLAALPLVRWHDPQRLEALMADCRGRGALLFNPHVMTVEDGGLGVIDADQVAAKARHDPAGLLNPGKLRGWSGQ